MFGNTTPSGYNNYRPNRREYTFEKIYEALGVLEIVLRLLVPCLGCCALFLLAVYLDGCDAWTRVIVYLLGALLVGVEFVTGWLANLIWQILVVIVAKIEESREGK